MKAIVQTAYGSPDVLELRDIDKPMIGDRDVSIRVHAAGVHRGDWLVMRGLPYIARLGYGLLTPKHRVAGMEVAGKVEGIGRNVTRFQPGAEVFSWCNGAFAEYVSVSEEALAIKLPTSRCNTLPRSRSPPSRPFRRCATPEEYNPRTRY